ncbi:MAG: DUF4304 domain-containing protein [Chitinophagales bacterium]
MLSVFGFKKNGNVFYRKNNGVISLIKFRKHTLLQEAFFIDFGTYYCDIETPKGIPNDTKWHLFGNIGNFNPKYRPWIELNSTGKQEFIEDLDFEFIDRVIPFLNDLSNIEYLKINLKYVFESHVVSPRSSKILNSIVKLVQ